MKLKDLFITFMKIGSLAFGGGYTIMAIVEKDLVKKRKWLTDTELSDYLAMSQTLPGIIAINLAAFVGYKHRRFWGAVTAVSGVIALPIIIVLALAHFIEQVTHYPLFNSMLFGIKIAVCGLLLLFVWNMCKYALKGYISLVIFAATMTAYLFWNIHPVWPIMTAGLVGAVYYKYVRKVFNA